MSFDPVSFALGEKAGGGGREPVLESLSVTENGIYTPSPGVDGFDSVEVSFDDHYGEGYNQGYERGYEDGRAAAVLTSLQVSQNGIYEADGSGADGYDRVEVDVPIEFAPLADQASAWDIRSGTEAYDHEGNVIQGTYEPPVNNNTHQVVSVLWDSDEAAFQFSSDIAAAMMATIIADGAVTGYLANDTTSIPIPVVIHIREVSGADYVDLVMTGGVTIGNNDDKYVTQSVFEQTQDHQTITGKIASEKTYYIRAITCLTRHLADWGPQFLAMFLRT